MGSGSPAEVDAWLRGGGLVVTASERAARFLTAAFHRARRAEGLTAWPAPSIQDWQFFLRTAWNERSPDSRLVLSPIQEHSLWAAIIAAAEPEAAQLDGARDRLATLAQQAHLLLSTYSPDLLAERRREGWDQDAAAFSSWLSAFDETCRANNLVSLARLPLELIPALNSDPTSRPPILLAGFDRILPVQQEIFAVWGETQPALPGQPAERVAFHAAHDAPSELAACALWCQQQLAANPNARLIVVTQNVSTLRGEIERAMLRYAPLAGASQQPASPFEFSLGVKLSQVSLARSGSLLLHWLNGSIAEQELDWLLSSGYAAAPGDSAALAAFMRAVRRRNLQRIRWTLADFLRQRPGIQLPGAWSTRMLQAQRRLLDYVRSLRTPLEWAEFVPQLLKEIGWPDSRPLSSAEFQAHRSWQQVLDGCASLGFDGRRILWNDFLARLDRTIDETLFAPESKDAPILIAGPAETAGLTADAIWFMGADEDAWPSSGSTHPLLPLAVQRQAGLPHATPHLDWELAGIATRRLLSSAPEVHFSYARHKDAVDTRPSRLIVQIAGDPAPLPSQLLSSTDSPSLTIDFPDAAQLPFLPGQASGGSATLTAQSQCPFKAFATSRLNAGDWDPAEAGLTAAERGQLLHEVLHSVWAGAPAGIRSHADLLAVADIETFVARHVQMALQEKLPLRARDSMPPRYLALEAARLTHLVTEWLRYESTRIPFTVFETEVDTHTSIDGLQLHLRLDRIDRLNDSTLLVIDYKTGNVSPKSWELPRPDDVQLPLYSGFALGPGERLGGLVFAKLRPGERNREFAGRLRNARETLLPDLNNARDLARKPLTDDQVQAWRDAISQLARDFLAGRATVTPREYPQTCEQCRLQALCRIQENPLLSPDDENTNEETADA